MSRAVGNEILDRSELEDLPGGSLVLDRTGDVHVKTEHGWYYKTHYDEDIDAHDPVEYDLMDYAPLFVIRGSGDELILHEVVEDHACEENCDSEHVEDHDCDLECQREHTDDGSHSCEECCENTHYEVYFDSDEEEPEQELYINGDFVCKRWELPRHVWTTLTDGI